MRKVNVDKVGAGYRSEEKTSIHNTAQQKHGSELRTIPTLLTAGSYRNKFSTIIFGKKGCNYLHPSPPPKKKSGNRASFKSFVVNAVETAVQNTI